MLRFVKLTDPYGTMERRTRRERMRNIYKYILWAVGVVFCLGIVFVCGRWSMPMTQIARAEQPEQAVISPSPDSQGDGETTAVEDKSTPTPKPSMKPMLKFSRKKASITAGKKYVFKVVKQGIAEKVQWSVSNKKLASINAKGKLSAKQAGKVKVTAKAGKVKVSCQVKIRGKKKIALDPGHQTYADLSLEQIGPGSSVKKEKMTGGASGVASGVPEYKLTMTVCNKMKKELLKRGYEVYMTRTKNNVKKSCVERAKAVNKSGSDICIRIHADSFSASSAKGASALYPTTSNPYLSDKLCKKSKKLSDKVLSAMCKKAGCYKRGLSGRDDLSGTNWSKIPVTLIEMGFLSNPEEDLAMQSKSYQTKLVKGMCNGIDAYFGY